MLQNILCIIRYIYIYISMHSLTYLYAYRMLEIKLDKTKFEQN